MNRYDYVALLKDKAKLKSLKVQLYPRFYGNVFHDYCMNYYFLHFKNKSDILQNHYRKNLMILADTIIQASSLNNNDIEMLAVNFIESNLPFKRWLYED